MKKKQKLFIILRFQKRYTFDNVAGFKKITTVIFNIITNQANKFLSIKESYANFLS